MVDNVNIWISNANMNGGTAQRLIAAAAELLDSGGIHAVTLRAVADRVGVSHNAPYRHFDDRNALLAAVAELDFIALSRQFERKHSGNPNAVKSLKLALKHVVAYGRAHPARYRLLFSDPDIASRGGTLEVAAMAAFGTFQRLVQTCQESDELPKSIDSRELTALIYATLHGLMDLELGGRARAKKGLADVEHVAGLLIDILARHPTTMHHL